MWSKTLLLTDRFQISIASYHIATPFISFGIFSGYQLLIGILNLRIFFNLYTKDYTERIKTEKWYQTEELIENKR